MYIVEVQGMPLMTERKVYKLHNIIIDFFSKYCRNSFRKAIKFSIEMDYTQKTSENIKYFEYWSSREHLYESQNKLKHLTDDELEHYWELKIITKCLVYFRDLSRANTFSKRVNTGYSREHLNLRLDKIHILEAKVLETKALEAKVLERNKTSVLTTTNRNTKCCLFNMFNKNNELDTERKSKLTYFEILPLECIHLIYSNLTATELLKLSQTNKVNRNIVSNLNIWNIVNEKVLRICNYLDKVEVYKGKFECTDKDLIKVSTDNQFNYYDVEFYVNSFEFTFKLKRTLLSNIFKETQMNEIYKCNTFNLFDLIKNIKSSKYFKI